MEKILIVDDEQEIINMLKRNLEVEGYDVTGATSGKEAVELMKEHSFYLVLLDIKFPDDSGTNILRELKKIHPPVNVLMITGYASHENIMESLGDGAVDYLTKPLDMDTVIDRLQQLKQKVDRWRDEIGIE